MRKRLTVIILILLLVSCKSNEQSQDDFLENYSLNFPNIISLIDSFEIDNNNISLLVESESELVFSFNTDLSYYEIDKIILSYSELMSDEYNTSLSGNFSMEDDGYINYNVSIFENNDFRLDLSNINNSKQFKKDNKDIEYIRKIGKNNILVEFSYK